MDNSNLVTQFNLKEREQIYMKVANRCATQLNRGVEKRGLASIVVPGGSTPAPLFEKLSKMPLFWNNVIVTLSDERWLPPEHPQSNQNLVQNSLLVNRASDARFIPLKNSAVTPQKGVSTTEKGIASIGQPFDLVVLGMGEDGHIASLFPGCPQLESALNPQLDANCIAIDATGCPVAGENTQRISLTLSAILNSELIILLVTGEDKFNVIQAAIKEQNPINKPVAALFKQARTPVEIYWAE